jgi:hypothetical protein
MLALALDDVLYSPALLKDVDFKRDLKIAANYNIAVLIATANAGVLPDDVHTFATHVLATKCVAAREPRLLAPRLFVMFKDADSLSDVLALCKPFEFVVGVLRERVVHSYVVPHELRVFHMAQPLLEKLSFALDQGPPRRGKLADTATTA